MAVAPTPEPELFKEHLFYALAMLHETLLSKSKNAATNNALMDSFCTYARLLIEFFEKRGKKYTRNYEPFCKISRKKLKETIQRLNSQVAHLIFDGRVAQQSAKITGQERYEIYDLLRAEVATFNKHADAQHKLPELPSVSISAINTASATNVVKSIGPWHVGR